MQIQALQFLGTYEERVPKMRYAVWIELCYLIVDDTKAKM